MHALIYERLQLAIRPIANSTQIHARHWSANRLLTQIEKVTVTSPQTQIEKPSSDFIYIYIYNMFLIFFAYFIIFKTSKHLLSLLITLEIEDTYYFKVVNCKIHLTPNILKR